MTTPFKNWRLAEGLTQAKAAEVLGISISHVNNLDAGRSRTTGQTITPDKPLRKLMQAYSEMGRSFEPYPLR